RIDDLHVVRRYRCNGIGRRISVGSGVFGPRWRREVVAVAGAMAGAGCPVSVWFGVAVSLRAGPTEKAMAMGIARRSLCDRVVDPRLDGVHGVRRQLFWLRQDIRLAGQCGGIADLAVHLIVCGITRRRDQRTNRASNNRVVWAMKHL